RWSSGIEMDVQDANATPLVITFRNSQRPIAAAFLSGSPLRQDSSNGSESWVLDNPPSDRSGSVYLDLYDQDENKVFAVADGLQSQNLGEQFGSPEHYGDLGQGYYAKGTY
ncbi:hypothetical protein H632_c1428p1, partial [Helicosporidium sp. ATCC 50920]